jgi:glycosyltransferase involved in cell wall biosynthesis
VKAVIFLPAFNEEQSISEVLRSLPTSLQGVDTVERLVVDDGSTDRTAEIAEEEGAIVVRHFANRGVGKAFHTAVDEALRLGADLLVTIDADGQFDSAQIPELIRPIVDDKADLVTGCRFVCQKRPENMPHLKYWGNLTVARLLRFLAGVDLADVSCGFRAYSREALLNLNLFGKFTYTQETILDLSFKGLRIGEVPVNVRYLEGRKSRVAGSVFRYAINAGKIITKTVRDFRPLRFFGTIGLAVFLLGLVLDGWLLWYYLTAGTFSPYKIIGFTGAALNIVGILLAGLGLVADMLDRIRSNQERILYYHKRHVFEDGPFPSGNLARGTREVQTGAGPRGPHAKHETEHSAV